MDAKTRPTTIHGYPIIGQFELQPAAGDGKPMILVLVDKGDECVVATWDGESDEWSWGHYGPKASAERYFAERFLRSRKIDPTVLNPEGPDRL